MQSMDGFGIQEVLTPRGKDTTGLKILEQCLPDYMVLSRNALLSFTCLERRRTVVDPNRTSHQPDDLRHLKDILGLRHGHAACSDLVEDRVSKCRCIMKFMNRLYRVMVVERYERQQAPFYAIQAS